MSQSRSGDGGIEFVLPNIVWIVADDMGYGDPGCYGATKIPTPHIDRLASQGMRFTDAHATSAVCTPSRYSIITGRYCWRTRLQRHVLNGFSLPLIEPDRVTVANMLKRRGYATACVGKWHLGLGWTTKDGWCGPWSDWRDKDLDDGFNVDYTVPIRDGPNALGFDYFFGFAASLNMPPYCFIQDDRTVGTPNLEKAPVHGPQWRGPMVPGWDDALVDGTFTEKATAWLESHVARRPDQPFFLYLATCAPHRPCVPPAWVRGASQAGPRGDMVALFDWVVGQVVNALDRAGVAEHTFVFVTSDNGAMPADVDGNTYGHKSCGEWRGFKGDIWEGGHRVPLIASWPGRVPPGSVCDQTVCLSDLMATAATAAGADLPGDAAPDSCDILPLLLGADLEGPLRGETVHHSWDGYFALRQGPWKAIWGQGSGGFIGRRKVVPAADDPAGQLYNLQRDPTETTDLWEERAAMVDALGAKLEHCKAQERSRP